MRSGKGQSDGETVLITFGHNPRLVLFPNRHKALDCTLATATGHICRKKRQICSPIRQRSFGHAAPIYKGVSELSSERKLHPIYHSCAFEEKGILHIRKETSVIGYDHAGPIFRGQSAHRGAREVCEIRLLVARVNIRANLFVGVDMCVTQEIAMTF